MTRWLQSTVIGAIYAELRDQNIAVTDAQFSRSGDVRDFWTERLDARDEQILMTWYRMGEPFLVHTQPNSVPGRPYGMCTVLIPADGARLTPMGSRQQVSTGRESVKVAPQVPASWVVRKLDRGSIGVLQHAR